MAVRPLAVLFDLDGTLIDTIELILNSAKHAFQRSGRVAPPDEEWLAGIGTPLVAMFGKYANDEAGVTDLIAKYREYQLEHHDRLTRCYDEIVDVVERLDERGHPLGIVTSKTVAMARRGLDHVGLGDRFDVVVGCDSSERHKPDPEPVRVALRQLGYAPADAVFVGDSVHDMAAGNAAGVTTIAALWGPFSRATLSGSRPAHYAERPSAILELLARLRPETPAPK